MCKRMKINILPNYHARSPPALRKSENGSATFPLDNLCSHVPLWMWKNGCAIFRTLIYVPYVLLNGGSNRRGANQPSATALSPWRQGSDAKQTTVSGMRGLLGKLYCGDANGIVVGETWRTKTESSPTAHTRRSTKDWTHYSAVYPVFRNKYKFITNRNNS